MDERRRGGGSIVFVTGAPEAGKSLLIADCLTYELRAGARVVILDVTGDMEAYLRARGIDDVARVATVGEAQWVTTRVILFAARDGVEVEAVCDAWLDFCVKHKRQGDVLVCDEAELVFPSGVARGQQLRLVKLARNWGVRLYLATQRPQYVSTLVRANATHVAVFAGDSLNYIDPGCREFGEPDVFRPALSLPQHHYLYRPRRRADPLAPLEVINAREEAAPWVE